MIVSHAINSLRSTIQQWKSEGFRIGFVPTMGHLHAGHIELVNSAKAQCDKVVVSIFINPLQFNESSDFESYPKTLETDQVKLAVAETDLLFLPDTELMYPNGQDSLSKVSVPGISESLEGECRPGHFDGVATVVNKLFNLVQPHIAFFGEKDFQQLLLIKKMVFDLNLPIEIESVATCRESDGLAMSSRNSRLTDEHRRTAPELYKVLQKIAQQLKDTEDPVQQLELEAMQVLKQQGFEPEYVSVRAYSDLQAATEQTSGKVVLAAAWLGGVRLIDNLIVD